jgi:hypothetical protein
MRAGSGVGSGSTSSIIAPSAKVSDCAVVEVSTPDAVTDIVELSTPEAMTAAVEERTTVDGAAGFIWSKGLSTLSRGVEPPRLARLVALASVSVTSSG